MPTPTSRTARVEDPSGPVPLHYAVVGPDGGPPVVMLHGFPEDHTIFLPLADRLPGWRPILPDLRGFGLSGKPPGGYDLETMTGDLAAVLDDAGVTGSVPVVGHDIGGMVAVAFALSRPDRVSRLVDIEGPPPGLDADGWDAFRQQFWHFGLFAQQDLPEALIGGREKEFCAWFLRRYAGRKGVMSTAETDRRAAALAVPGGLRGALGTYRTAAQNAEFVSTLAGQRPFAGPVLGLGGAHCLGGWVGELLATAFDDVTAETIPDCGHWVPVERPDRLADRLRTFLG